MVCTAGRLIRVHTPPEVGRRSHPGQGSAPGDRGGKSHGSRRSDSSLASGGYAYGEMPAACTLPSHAYRYMSSLVRGAPASPASASARLPAATSPVAARRGTFRTTTTAAANSSHPAPYQYGSRSGSPEFPPTATVAATTPTRAASSSPSTAVAQRLSGGAGGTGSAALSVRGALTLCRGLRVRILTAHTL